MKPLINPFSEGFANIRHHHPLTLSSRARLRIEQWFSRGFLCVIAAGFFYTFSVVDFGRIDVPLIDKVANIFLLLVFGLMSALTFLLAEPLYVRWRLRREQSSLLTYLTPDFTFSLARQLCDFHRQTLPAQILEVIPHTKVWLVDKPEQYARGLLDEDLEVRIKALRKVLDPNGPGLSFDIQCVNDMVAMKHQMDANEEKQARITRILQGTEQPSPPRRLLVNLSNESRWVSYPNNTAPSTGASVMFSPARRTAVAHPDNISAGEIVLHWLDSNGYHGLYRAGACACTTADISPFNCLRHGCEAGHFIDTGRNSPDRIGAGGKCGSCALAAPARPTPVPPGDHDRHLAAYYKAGMLGEAPAYVPAQVKVLNETFGDFPFRGAGVSPGVHECESSRWGAVSVKARDGKWLGLRLNEFEPVSWRPNPKEFGAEGKAE